MTATGRLQSLAAQGQSIWIDLLSRPFVRSGELAQMVRDDAVTGLTSNPAIFQKAIAAGSDYDEQLSAELERTSDPRELFFALANTDVREACAVLRPVWDATEGLDGWVSLEVDPGLAHDEQATVDQAVALHAQVDRPNLYIKIPATSEGVSAFEECIARGIPVNVTLIFSVERYRAVTAAYLRGLMRLSASGGNVAAASSVASFFVSRLDTEVDARLDARGASDPAALELRGLVGVANARLAYRHFEETFAGPVWERLAASGARPQRPLWASTSTKNPAYRDTLYVEELIGPHTVNTMPPETLVAFRDHGEVRGDTVLEGIDEATSLLVRLTRASVDLDDVFRVLEDEGVQKFADAFDQLIAGIEAKRAELAAG